MQNCLINPGSGKANYMLLAERDQMVLFDEDTYEALLPETLQAPASSHSPSDMVLGLALIVIPWLLIIVISWLPIALLIWFLT
jgi:hypothetical protein